MERSYTLQHYVCWCDDNPSQSKKKLYCSVGLLSLGQSGNVFTTWPNLSSFWAQNSHQVLNLWEFAMFPNNHRALILWVEKFSARRPLWSRGPWTWVGSAWVWLFSLIHQSCTFKIRTQFNWVKENDSFHFHLLLQVVLPPPWAKNTYKSVVDIKL